MKKGTWNIAMGVNGGYRLLYNGCVILTLAELGDARRVFRGLVDAGARPFIGNHDPDGFPALATDHCDRCDALVADDDSLCRDCREGEDFDQYERSLERAAEGR